MTCKNNALYTSWKSYEFYARSFLLSPESVWKLWSRNETQDSDVAPRKVPPRRAGSLLVDNLRSIRMRETSVVYTGGL